MKFARSVAARYFRLTAKAELSGRPFTSIAELDPLTLASGRGQNAPSTLARAGCPEPPVANTFTTDTSPDWFIAIINLEQKTKGTLVIDNPLITQ